MKLLTRVLCCIIGTGGVAIPARAAFSDKLCPEATQYVVAIGELKAAPPLGATAGGDSAQKVYDAVHATTSAYDTCAKRHLANANVEPGVHYAFTRQASFEVLEARALLALARHADAKTTLEHSRRLALDVVEWRQSAYQSGSSISSSGSDTRPSVYRDSAKDVVAAAEALLAKVASANASPSAAPSPHR